MPTSRPALSYDVFVAPSKLAKAPPPRIGEPRAWDPTTSTLIFGARDAMLVDTLMTVREATALADWIELHDRRLTTIYITHGHGDHYSGLSCGAQPLPGRAGGGHGGNGGTDAQRQRHAASLQRVVPRTDR